MRILLISNPSARRQRPDFPPPGIAYLGAVARCDGHEVRLIDASLRGIGEIVREVQEFAPELIGVTCWTIDRGEAWRLTEALRVAAPAVPLVMGGPHATIFPGHVLKRTHAQAVILSEGEETFSEYMKALSSHGDVRRVAGLVLRDPAKGMLATPPRGPIPDIDTIPMPYYEGFKDFDFADYAGFLSLPQPTAAVISSRGCVFDCTYCASVRFWGRRWRQRSSQNVLEEIRVLVERYGVKSIYFFDDNFPVNRERAMRICQGMIDNRWGLRWACCSHVKMLNKPLLELMKASGCVTIDFGVESGSDKILTNINKQQARADIERAFRLSREAGISARAYLMVGNPGENEATIDETIDLVAKINPQSSIGASLLWLLPGTEVYEKAVQAGFISEKYWLEHDDVPYNTQEHSLPELEWLRNRLMAGIAKSRPGIGPRLTYLLKRIYYKYPFLSVLRGLVPKSLR